VLPNSHGVTVQGSTQNASMFHISYYTRKRTVFKAVFKTNEAFSPRDIRPGYRAD
jgi:hypothetical protein